MNISLDNVFESIPELRKWIPPVYEIQGLGGLTNQNFLIQTHHDKFVLRIPGRGTEEYISRINECEAAWITSSLGINAPILYFDRASGIQLAQYLENSCTMNSERFKDK